MKVVPIIPQAVDLPEAVQALKERERAFVWIFMFNGGNGSDAARRAGYSNVKEGAKVRAHELLQRSDIQEALRVLCGKYLFSLAPLALAKLRDHLTSKNEKVSLKAVEMTLSRTGFGERTTLDVNVEVKTDHTKAAVDELRYLLSKGASREFLENHFGFSGLSRYEKLLASENAKLIEATVEIDRG